MSSKPILAKNRGLLKSPDNVPVHSRLKSFKSSDPDNLKLKPVSNTSVNDKKIRRFSSRAQATDPKKIVLKDNKTFSELQAAENMKNILFCSISHELRNPVNHLNGILDLVKSYAVDEKISNFINIALSSVDLLISKIDDILDYSLLETDTIQLKTIKFNIRELMQNVVDTLSLQFDRKMIKFSLQVEDNVPQEISFDKKRLKQVLMNLIFNALKYTEQGFVTVRVAASYSNKLSKFRANANQIKGTKECDLKFSVSDSGCGIEK